MRWKEVLRESDDISSQIHDSVMDIITPLQSQGVASITVQQILDQLTNDPDYQGLSLSDDLVIQALDGVPGITVGPDTANNGTMTVMIDNSTPTTDAAQHKTDQQQDKVDQAATRQATADLGESFLKEKAKKSKNKSHNEYPQSAHKWVEKRVSELYPEHISDEGKAFGRAWNEYKSKH